MTVAATTTAPAPAAGSNALTRALARSERRRRMTAIALTLPLLLFLLVTLLVPIGALLVRAIENPEVADALPRTGQAHRALADAEMAAALLARIQHDLRTHWRVAEPSHALLQAVQRCARPAVPALLARHAVV